MLLVEKLTGYLRALDIGEEMICTCAICNIEFPYMFKVTICDECLAKYKEKKK